MRPGPQAVVRRLAARVVLLTLALAAFALLGAPQAAGVAAGALAAAAAATYLVAFGVSAATVAAPPAVLRAVAVAGIVLAGAAGLWAAHDAAFAFDSWRIGGLSLSPGGALMHLAAFAVVAAGAAFVFACIAGRASALDAGR